MRFRLRAFGLHLLCSACLMAIVLSGLYFGWYRWPGWYLSGALKIALIMACIDVVLGPLMTLVIANPGKRRRELTRDIGIIIVIQLIAAGYGSTTLWRGRPLYYTYSERFLEMVQASDLDEKQIELGRKFRPDLAPHWYSLPRWVFAPLPKDTAGSEIAKAAMAGGDDVIQMPRFYKPWAEALPEILQNLRVVGHMGELIPKQQKRAQARMRELGIPTDQANALPMTGKDDPLVAIVDAQTAQIKEWIRVD